MKDQLKTRESEASERAVGGMPGVVEGRARKTKVWTARKTHSFDVRN